MNYLKQSQTNPNYKNRKMNVTALTTMATNNEQRTMNYLKQTQSNPNLPDAGAVLKISNFAVLAKGILTITIIINPVNCRFKTEHY
jgi:hypothetical protein